MTQLFPGALFVSRRGARPVIAVDRQSGELTLCVRGEHTSTASVIRADLMNLSGQEFQQHFLLLSA